MNTRAPETTRTPRDDALMARALRWSELFSHWSDAHSDALLKFARLVRYPRRTQVLARASQRRELLVVVSGCLEISSIGVLGQKYVHNFLGPGHVVPLVRLLEERPLESYDYHAHEDSVVIHLPCDAVIAVLDSEPTLWRDVAWLSLRRQRLSMAALQIQNLGSIRCRVAATLMNLVETSGLEQQAGVKLRLSQHHLAAMLSLSRQTINKELGALVDRGVIELSYKHVIVRDQDALRRISAEG